MKRILFIAAIVLAACDKPGVAPGLDETALTPPGVISGNVVYTGEARGDVVLFLFDSEALPPPDGTGTSAQAVARIPASVMFANAAATSVGPFTAPYTFTQVPTRAPVSKKYRIRAFIDATHEFDPFFDFTQQPRAGDPSGGYGAIGTDGLPHELDVPVPAGQIVTGINVALIKTIPFDPPSFVIKNNAVVALQTTMDQPARISLQAVKLAAKNASFGKAKFGLELDRGPDGLRRSSTGDGLDDVFPKVFLRQIKATNGAGQLIDVAAADVAIVPCRVIPTAVLPILAARSPLADPIGADTLDVLVEPLAFHSDNLVTPLPKIPAGRYQIIVVERTGQVWTLPNSLGDEARFGGTEYYAVSQAASVSVEEPIALPDGVLKGKVIFHGSDASLKSGNILVQAYLDDPANPPPPLGVALPVRVELIAQSTNRVIPDSTGGFTVDYRIVGLPAPGKYIVQALADVDGNFSPLNLLQTPTRGDLVGAHTDAGGKVASVTVGHGEPTSTTDVEVHAMPDPMDPPAFELEGAAVLAAESVQPVRFDVVAKPLSFPIASGSADATAFTVRLVRDAVGNPVDADGDGLPDVWPRVFLVRLDPADATDLSQYRASPTSPVLTQVIPAAVDPTPFLAALSTPGARIKAKKLSIVARPAAVDVTDRSKAPQRMALGTAAGKYKVVLVNDTGQVWQVPNEAAPQALDAHAICDAAAPACAEGTVQTQSQGRAFVVLPADGSAPGKSIDVTLNVAGVSAFSQAYVFAYSVSSPPPTGQPVAVDVHSALEFTGTTVKSAAFKLAGLPSGVYIVTAIIDTRGDFAASPTLYAAAPGEGTVLGGYVDQTTGALLPVDLTTAPTQAVSAVASGARVLPARPSFQLVDAGLQPLSSDLTVFGSTGVTPARIKLAAGNMLQGVGVVAESNPVFAVSYAKCVGSAAQDLDGDNLPDLYPQLRLIKIDAADPTGLRPELDAEGNVTVIPASLDPSRYVPQLACNAGVSSTLSDPSALDVIVAPAAFKANARTNAVGLQLTAVPAGRYQVVLIAASGQVWRIPNELQPSLLDPSTPAAISTRLATQGAAISVSGTTVPQGEIHGTVTLSGFAGAPGTVLVLAYRADDPPPPLGGTGRPVVVRIAHRSSNGGFSYTLPSLPDSDYFIAALVDSPNQVSPLMSILSSPSRGSRATFFTAGGAVPVPVTVAGGAQVGGKDLALDATLSPALPFERPAFAIESGGTLAGTPVSLTLAPADLTGFLPYAPAPVQLPMLTPNGAGGFVKDASGYVVSTQVLFSPTAAGQTCAPVAILTSSAYCTAFTGTADCSAAATGLAAAGTKLSVTVPATTCVQLSDKSVVAQRPSSGAWRVNVVQPKFGGQAWAVPNEVAAGGGVALSQGGAFIVQ